MRIKIREEELILDNERAIFLPQQHLLAISDLHLGKAAHFRKSGIAVSNEVSKNDLARLSTLLLKYQPETLLINGDMFHSDYNSEIDEFATWKKAFSTIEFVLVKGNHDKQKEGIYTALDITIYENSYFTNTLCFTHDAAKVSLAHYVIGGHIHPGINLRGPAKQRLKLPCFYFGKDYGILPAFSYFTGLQILTPEPTDEVYAITPTQVVKV